MECSGAWLRTAMDTRKEFLANQAGEGKIRPGSNGGLQQLPLIYYIKDKFVEGSRGSNEQKRGITPISNSALS